MRTLLLLLAIPAFAAIHTVRVFYSGDEWNAKYYYTTPPETSRPHVDFNGRDWDEKAVSGKRAKFNPVTKQFILIRSATTYTSIRYDVLKSTSTTKQQKLDALLQIEVFKARRQ